MTRASSTRGARGSRLAEFVGSICAGNLAVIALYELATVLAPGWGGRHGGLAALVTALVAGAAGGWLLVRSGGGKWALAGLALLLVVETGLSARGLASVGRGYASWTVDGVVGSGTTLLWAGLAGAFGAALAGRVELLRRRSSLEGQNERATADPPR